MHLKIIDDAEVYQTAKYGKHNGRTVLNVTQEEIIDCDSLQAQKNTIRPRIIEDVIVA